MLSRSNPSVEGSRFQFSDPSNEQFEPSLAWLDHLRLVYLESEETENEDV